MHLPKVRKTQVKAHQNFLILAGKKGRRKKSSDPGAPSLMMILNCRFLTRDLYFNSKGAEKALKMRQRFDTGVIRKQGEQTGQ